MNLYAEGEKVYAKDYEHGTVPLYLKTFLKSGEHLENEGHKWVYTLAKGDTEADKALPETYAEGYLRESHTNRGMCRYSTLKSWI